MIRTAALVGLCATFASMPTAAQGQSGATVVGAFLGAAGGGLVSTAWVALDARHGRYVHSVDDIGWRALPIPAGLAVGLVLGARNGNRLWRSVGYGASGLAVGGLVGAIVGDRSGDDGQGRWTGMVVGSAAGLVVGSVVGAVGWSPTDEPVPLFSWSMTVGR